mmetsp:Transcript_22945/g.58373  ORF Transcript_22945/g.58373 Transcript_22945/m.58373 type:complete len:329 (-) Transcript_22945:400-1386(-)
MADRHGEPWSQPHVHLHQHVARGHGGAGCGRGRAGVPKFALVRQGSPQHARSFGHQGPRRGRRCDHPPPVGAVDAPLPEGHLRGRALDGVRVREAGGQDAGLRGRRRRRRRQGHRRAPRLPDSDPQGLPDGGGQGGSRPRDPGVRRSRLHQRQQGGAGVPRRAHRGAVGGYDADPGARPPRTQDHAAEAQADCRALLRAACALLAAPLLVEQPAALARVVAVRAHARVAAAHLPYCHARLLRQGVDLVHERRLSHVLGLGHPRRALAADGGCGRRRAHQGQRRGGGAGLLHGQAADERFCLRPPPAAYALAQGGHPRARRLAHVAQGR